MTSLQNASSHTPANRRKKLTTIIFDTDFFIRPKTRLLIRKHGLEAASFYMAVVCWMAYEESSDRIDATGIRLVCEDLELDLEFGCRVLDECAELGMLRKEDGFFISDRLASELNILTTKQNNYHSGALAREEAKRSKILLNPAQASKSEHVRKEQEKDQEQDQEEEQEEEPLQQYGVVLRMKPSEMIELQAKFTPELVTQELPEADLWLQKAQTPSARKYRKPKHNHYLFMRTTWLKDKRLSLPNGTGPPREFKSFAQLEHERKMKILEELCDDAN